MGVTLCPSHGRRAIRLVCEHLAMRGAGPSSLEKATAVSDREFSELEGWLCIPCVVRHAETPFHEVPFVPVCGACFAAIENS